MIQFDDPACLLFTSVSPQTGFISKILEDFKIKCALAQSIGVGCYSATSSNPRGSQKKIIQLQRFSKARLSSFFFSSEIITFINLRALSWEVRCVQTVLKFSTVGQLNLECYLVRLQKKKNLKIYCFQKKRCDWIIFFQLPRFKQSHCNVPITWRRSARSGIIRGLNSFFLSCVYAFHFCPRFRVFGRKINFISRPIHKDTKKKTTPSFPHTLKSLYFECYQELWLLMLYNNADAHTSSLGYLWFAELYKVVSLTDSEDGVLIIITKYQAL